jgi:hypothetical protein
MKKKIKEKKNKVWLGQVKDVPKITLTNLKAVIEKLDKYEKEHRNDNIEGYEITGGREGNGITKAAKAEIEKLNNSGYNIIYNSDKDSETQIKNLKNRIHNKNKT